MSFASQKNDMLLRNMIYSLNANMIGSTASNMICSSDDERCSYSSALDERKGGISVEE